jgi:AcrR family transcriptional regulator
LVKKREEQRQDGRKDDRPRQRRSPAQLREEILRAAEAEYSQFGFSGATTAAIAARAKTTETQIFRYFNSKAELFREAILRPLDGHLQNFMAGNPAAGSVPREAQAKSYIAELQDFILQHQRMFLSLIVAETGKDSDVQGMAGVDALHDYFARGAEVVGRRTGGEDKLPPELMVRISFASVLGCVLFKDWLYPEGMADDAMIRAATTRFVMDGIYAEPAVLTQEN